MFKKYSALFLVMVAYAILMGHGIVPHHHHSDHHELLEHHQSGKHHDAEDNKGLSHIFSHFVHSADSFTLITKNIGSKIFLSLAAVLPDNYSVDEILIPPLSYQPPAEHLDNLFSHACTFGLRAPPAFVA